MKNKKERLDAIKEIIVKSRINNQDELLEPPHQAQCMRR